MTKDDIIALPHKNLRQRSKKVGYVGEEVQKLIEEMRLSTLDWENSRAHEVGVALAAVQVNKILRVVIVRNDFENKQDTTFKAFINPEITKFEGEVIEDYEGCLSIKDVYGKVPRYEKVKVKALDAKGRPFRITATGFLARVLQHEIDHTNGVVFIDHLKDREDAFFKLNEEGKIEPLDYEKDVKDNKELWDTP
jgi:peptide deformylase